MADDERRSMTRAGRAALDLILDALVAAIVLPFALLIFRNLLRLFAFGDFAPALRALWGG